MSRLFIVVFLLLAFLTGCTATKDKADRALEKGDYVQAIKLYREVLEKEKLKAPEMAEVHFRLGRALDKYGSPENAAEEYRQAIEVAPSELKYYMSLADVLDDLGMIDQEIKILKDALILDNANPHAEAMLGTAYAKLGQYVNAIEMFDKAIKHNPTDPQNYINYGLVCEKLGDSGRSIYYWEEALKLKPDADAALLNLGVAYNRLKRYGDAVRVYSKLVSVKPGEAKFHSFLGIAYYNNAQYRDALREFQAVSKIDENFPGLKDYLNLARRGASRLAGRTRTGG